MSARYPVANCGHRVWFMLKPDTGGDGRCPITSALINARQIAVYALSTYDF